MRTETCQINKRPTNQSTGSVARLTNNHAIIYLPLKFLIHAANWRDADTARQSIRCENTQRQCNSNCTSPDGDGTSRVEGLSCF
ncbi:hypothetical protein [Agrobacterium tumefaciens]|uniref:Uncharacterized protein n=1 Tax=Agrobacterium tumefaciens TaxID=358 RepID=A0AA44JA72_AGRTU|nr:hypothetical protein [Agrobacterium tumefaciens]NSL21279.1 hypothetical protein [Agrobacterium tumefaciens]NTB83851.1 hypothetical protein [Agrobacterium tumefaciens]NTC20680.1 hypothetical protein [Agrobacterium tumefaciens]NTC29322.1 hypothetical protein [Agrobacterium tumefaciens]NTC57818.1 hypothetical protein [Agrobacterium tumefaciens]